MGGDVDAHDLEVEEHVLHPADVVVLDGAVSRAAVHHCGVHACGHERPGPDALARRVVPWRSGNSLFIQWTMKCWKVPSPWRLFAATASTPTAMNARASPPPGRRPP